MGKYAAAVFSDLEQHSLAWSRASRDEMVSYISAYRHLAESLASQYGSLHINFTGDGHLFLFESADAAVQFGLKLIGKWQVRAAAVADLKEVPHTPLRVGCHFGECMQLDDGTAWIGRAINLAKRVEDATAPDSLYVTENVLELVDLPLYRFEEAGSHVLKGDHLPRRILYRVMTLDEAALAAKPDEELTAEVWFLKGVALIGTGRENSQQEENSYREALRLRPEYAEAQNNLAVLLRAGGNEKEAARHYREALKFRPDYPEAHYNYAILLEARGSLAGALEHFGEALRLRSDYVDAHHSYANLLKARGDLATANKHYVEALTLRPTDPEIHNNYAILLEDQGDLQQAEAHYNEALRLRPEYLEAHYNYAILLENKREPERAEDHYNEALRIWPDYPEAHNNLAILLHMRGDIAEAEVHYGEALRLRPDDPETHYNYALLLKAKGKVAEAENHFRAAYELAPEVPTFKSAIKPPT